MCRECGGDRAFKFEASWLMEDNCADVVAAAWAASDVWGEGRVMDKLRSVANSLYSWNVNVLGDLEKRIKKLKKELESCRRLPIDAVLEGGSLVL